MKKHNTKPTATTEVVRCPRCNRPQPKRGGPMSSHDDTFYYCEHCRFTFDSDHDDESGYDDSNQESQIEQDEL